MHGPVSTTAPHGLAILLFSHSFHAMVLTSDLGPPGLLPLTRQEVGQAPGEVLPSRASCRDGGSRDTWMLESVVFIRNPVCPHLFLPLWLRMMDTWREGPGIMSRSWVLGFPAPSEVILDLSGGAGGEPPTWAPTDRPGRRLGRPEGQSQVGTEWSSLLFDF